MNKNLLIVEDDDAIRKMIVRCFEKLDFNLYEADNGKSAISLFSEYKIDLILLDLMIPEVDGLRVCEFVRRRSDVPIIMLTAKSQEEDKLRGFEYGTDEYITKPFSLKVLVARVLSLINRVEGKMCYGSGILTFGNLSVDCRTERVTIADKELTLRKKENDLLMLLAEKHGEIVSRELLLDKIWGYDYDGDPRTLDTHISRLRTKLGCEGFRIETLRGRGFRFNDQTISA